MGKPDKTLKVGGHTLVAVRGQSLEIAAADGLCVVSVMDLDGIVIYMYHPLSGWYIESDMRKGQVANDRA